MGEDKALMREAAVGEPVAWMYEAYDRVDGHIGTLTRKRLSQAERDGGGWTETALYAATNAGQMEAEQCAKIAECAFDDRPRSRVGHPSHMDWEDGYREGTRAAAAAIRAALSKTQPKGDTL